MADFITSVIDPGSELAEVLDAILRDLRQVVDYEHVRILLLPSVLDVRGADRADENDNVLITVRNLGTLLPLLSSITPLPLDEYPLNRLLMTMQKPLVITDTHYSALWVKEGPRDTIRAWIGAPLVVKGESIGVLTLHSSVPMKYTERDGLVVFAFASQAAEAIDKVRLLDQAQNRLHAMMALYDASLEVIGQSQDPDRLLRTLVRRAADLLRAEGGVLYALEPDRKTLRVAIAHGFTNQYVGATLAVGEGLGGRVYQLDEPIIVDDYRRWPGRSPKFSLDQRLSAILGIPLRWKNEVLGVLEICASTPTRHFDAQDRWLAELFANQVAIAMSNARLVEQSRRRLIELAALRDISLQMTSSLDLDLILSTICAHGLNLTLAENIHIHVWDEARAEYVRSVARWRSGEYQPVAHRPRPEGLTERVRRSGETIIIEEAAMHELFSTPEALTWGIQSIAGFPLKRRGGIQGVFSVAFTTSHHFVEDDLRVLNLLVDQAALAIDHAWLYQQLQIAQTQQAAEQQIPPRLASVADPLVTTD